MTNILSCFAPTTVVAVDDRMEMLNSIKSILDNNNVIIKTFTEPAEALRFINETSDSNSWNTSDLMINGDEGTSEWQSVMININKLHYEIYNENRFSRISVVISDYSMNGMNGVDLCASITDRNIQKILLTGAADEEIAIDAFNNGQIDRFIKKSTINLSSQLNDNLNRSIYRYFSIFTDDIAKHISVGLKTHLKDPVFANFFFNTCLARNFVEYYMLDTFGSYLFLSSSGKASLLSVLTESEINRIIEVGRESDEITQDIMEGLQSRECMLVCHNRYGTLPPVKEWGRYLMPARRLEGYQTYYFAFADSNYLDIDKEKIKSLDRFLIEK